MRATLIASATILLSACTVGPEYARPETEVTPRYRGDTGETSASIADVSWWEIYEDPVLQDLIREALTNNNDLRVAVARIEQAQAIAAQSNAVRYPQVGYGVGVSSGRNEFIGATVYNNGTSQAAFAGLLTASWEFDLWGRLKNLNQADIELALAAQANRDAVRLSLISDVAQAYFELLQLDREIEIAQAATLTFTETVRIFTLRRDGGTASNLEVSRADAALAGAAAQIPQYELASTLKENEINVLVGRAPRAIPRGETMLQQRFPPEIPAGLPAELLERRPDIKSAEATLRASNAQIGAAEAEKLPRIGLTSFFGHVSPDLTEFSSAGIAWSIAATFAGPIFDAGLTDAQIAQAKAVWNENVAHYDQTVLVSLREVADALISRIRLAEERQKEFESVVAYTESVKVSNQRYLAGKASYYEVLEAQQLLYPAESLLSKTQANELVAVVRLYKALGGGWKLDEKEWEGPVAAQRTITLPP